MANWSGTEIVKTIVNGTVRIVEAGTFGLIGYELMTRMFGGTSVVGTIVRSKSMNSVIKSMRNNIPKEQYTDETVQEIKDTVNYMTGNDDE